MNCIGHHLLDALEEKNWILKSERDSYGDTTEYRRISFPPGVIVAIARLTDCIEMTTEFINSVSQMELAVGDWREGRYAWKLEDLRPLQKPIPVKGRQGLWNIDPAVLGEIQSQTVNAELFNVKHPLEQELRSPTANNCSSVLGEISHASGWLEKYTKTKQLKDGTKETYPLVAGKRDPNQIGHWYWSYRWEQKRKDGGFTTRAVSLPKAKVEAVQLAVALRWSVPKILQFIRSEML